ncbi:MAG: antitoxin [Candidatus Dormibacteria bacterium]|jgi:plasmid stability protein|nr:antitoxin [Chloroflexota bacterium]HBV93669.1 antitoxin [Chloroflexota bacterium]
MARTTLDLPDDLMRAVRIRAVNEGHRLKDVIADLIRRGLAGEPGATGAGPRRVQLPLVICAHPARPGEELTPERVAQLLVAEEGETAAS